MQIMSILETLMKIMNNVSNHTPASLIHRNVLYDPNNPITYRELVARILPATTIKSAENFGGTQKCILEDENWFNKTLRWTMIMYFSVETDLKGENVPGRTAGVGSLPCLLPKLVCSLPLPSSGTSSHPSPIPHH